MTAGSIRGRLLLKFPGTDTLDIGEVSIPLTARVRPRVDSGSPQVAVELKADLASVRDTIQAIFAREARDE